MILTGAFTGMVLGLQIFLTLSRFGSEAFLGPAVALTLIRELGPVLCALIVTGRAGSALTAEIGIMRISEQIDALTVMALNPTRYLVVPPIVAGLLTFPLMTALFDVVGIFGGYLVSVELLGLSSGTYFGEMQNFVDMTDIMTGSEVALFRRDRQLGLHLQGLPLRARGRGVARHHPGRRAVVGLDPGLGLLPGVVAPVIRVEDLHRSFVGQRVLRVLTLQVAPGEIMVVIGRSGGGKSVLLKHLLGLLRPDSGRVVVNGTDITHLRGPALDRIRERYGVVFQGGALFDSMSVFDNVAFPLRGRRASAPADRGARGRSSTRWASRAWDTRTRRRSPEACASVAIARALVTEPEVSVLRRTDDRARPDPGQHDPPPDPRDAPQVPLHGGDGEPRDPGDLRHRRSCRHAPRRGDRGAGTPDVIQGSANPTQQFVRGDVEGALRPRDGPENTGMSPMRAKRLLPREVIHVQARQTDEPHEGEEAKPPREVIDIQPRQKEKAACTQGLKCRA